MGLKILDKLRSRSADPPKDRLARPYLRPHLEAASRIEAGFREWQGHLIDVCQRCLRLTTNETCENCGPLRWRWDPEEATALYINGGGFWPVAPESVTGHFVYNTHPAAGFRVPAKLWVEGTG